MYLISLQVIGSLASLFGIRSSRYYRYQLLTNLFLIKVLLSIIFFIDCWYWSGLSMTWFKKVSNTVLKLVKFLRETFLTENLLWMLLTLGCEDLKNFRPQIQPLTSVLQNNLPENFSKFHRKRNQHQLLDALYIFMVPKTTFPLKL